MAIQLLPTMDKEQIYDLIRVDQDARQYFFQKADERWLEWLWRNGFLDAINDDNAAPFPTRTPELQYLLRMAEGRPDIVVDIMLDTPISTDTRSLEVAYSFLRICSSLPADQLARVVGKIRNERWIPIVDTVFRHSAFECAEMLKTLADANDFESLLVLAEAVLAVRPREELQGARLYDHNPFYLEYLVRAGIFGQLASLQAEYAEGALALATRKLFEVLAINDEFGLFEVDFFTLQLGQADSWQAEVRELAAVVKTLAVRLIGERCDDLSIARDIYERHFTPHPDNRAVRRLTFFVLSLCPVAFKDHLKQAYFSLFEAENYYEVSSGAEYEKALRKGFHVLSTEERTEFIERILDTFGHRLDKKSYGSPILSMILPHLDGMQELKKLVENEGFVLDPNYEPQPDIRMEDSGAGIVSSRAPISKEEFGKLSIAQFAMKLRNEWTPAHLNALNTFDDHYNPMNAEGIGDLLKDDMPERLQEYIDNATLFFERDAVDPHYTYAFLCGIREAIKDHREVASDVNWDGVIVLCWAIKESGEKKHFPREMREPGLYENWLANWDAVHSALADMLRELLTQKDGVTLLDFGRYRDRTFTIVSYLLAYPDPSPADEDFEEPGSALAIEATRNDANERWATDPMTAAINTVRGRAFEAFNLFVLRDGKELKGDVKGLYVSVLQRENTRALMCMFGRYLANFFFQDKEWTRNHLPLIFPQDPVQKWLCSAAWEGYLSATLYGEMIFDPAIQSFYLQALELTKDDFPRWQRHFKDPDKGIAEHLALVFMHYKEFDLDHQLLKAFWENESPKQHAHFVQSLGRFFISKENTEEIFANNPESKGRLRDFWDWLLKEQEEQNVYKEFGLWIWPEKGIFDPAWLAQRVRQTLEKTNGLLEWQHDLIKAAPQMAQAAPEETLEIARLYLLEGGVRSSDQETIWLWDSDNKWVEAFGILARNPKFSVATTAVINQLIREGGRTFWLLKKVLTEEP